MIIKQKQRQSIQSAGSLIFISLLILTACASAVDQPAVPTAAPVEDEPTATALPESTDAPVDSVPITQFPTVTPFIRATRTPASTIEIAPTNTQAATPTDVPPPTATAETQETAVDTPEQEAPAGAATPTPTATAEAPATAEDTDTAVVPELTVTQNFEIVQFTDRVQRGEKAILEINVGPGWYCSLLYTDPAGIEQPLGDKIGTTEWRCGWTWEIPVDSPTGTGQLQLTVGPATEIFEIIIEE